MGTWIVNVTVQILLEIEKITKSQNYCCWPVRTYVKVTPFQSCKDLSVVFSTEGIFMLYFEVSESPLLGLFITNDVNHVCFFYSWNIHITLYFIRLHGQLLHILQRVPCNCRIRLRLSYRFNYIRLRRNLFCDHELFRCRSFVIGRQHIDCDYSVLRHPKATLFVLCRDTPQFPDTDNT